MQTTEARVRTLSASTLMHEPVENMQGERIGKIEDYMLDLDRGCVEYAVLSFGGFLGIGEKMFAIPWNSMTLDTTNHRWMLDVTKDRLEQAPGFDKNDWPDMSNPDYRDSIAAFWVVNASGDREREQSTYPGVQETQSQREERMRREGGGGTGSTGGSYGSGGNYGSSGY